MSKREGLFREAGNNEGLACPFKPIICESDDCHQCQIYLDWEKLGELIQICAWCSKVIDRMPGVGHPVISHGICRECIQEYFGIKAEGEMPHGAKRRSHERHG